MHTPSSHYQALSPVPVWKAVAWRSVLLVGLLWLAALYTGTQTTPWGAAKQNGIATAIDAPLHANSEHSFSLKRFFSRTKSQPNTLESPEPLWLLLASEFRLAPASDFVRQSLLAEIAPAISWLQLQSLNVPRAPPLV